MTAIVTVAVLVVVVVVVKTTRNLNDQRAVVSMIDGEADQAGFLETIWPINRESTDLVVCPRAAVLSPLAVERLTMGSEEEVTEIKQQDEQIN